MASAPSRSAFVLALVLTAVIALLAGAGSAWLFRSSEIDDLTQRLETAERRLAEIAEGEDALPEDEAAPEDETPPDDAAEPGTAEPGSGGAAGPTERVPALVTSVRTSGGTHYVTLDYIQFLTGAEAAAAAAAAGEESPPPNDYFILNENPRLREYPVRSGIAVSVVFNADGTSNPEGRNLTLDDWITGTAAGGSTSQYVANFYWVSVTGGTVTELTQQYVP
jgi:hypothetical protein